MASDLPIPQSYEQLNSDMLSSYASKVGVNDFNVGSAVTSFFEVVALTTARASGDVFQILRDFSVDRATGSALKRLALENNVTPISAKPATGSVSVTDSSFTKVSTKIYAGAQPPNVGSTQIRVSDASLFTPTGSLYIGRGTPNVEGPLPYTSITPSGGFFIINLTSGTTKFHNLGETVVLARGGNRAIPANTLVLSPSSGSSPDVRFSVTTAAVILDGETEVGSVSISALSPGSTGNVPRGAIKQFAAPPFIGATVTNPLPFTTGSDSETDDQLRIRIKRAQASTGLGTATAIKSSVIGASPSDENATIVSDEIVSSADGATLYIDDGTGYEAKTAGVGLESIVDSALGGEQFFQLATGGRQAPVAKAFLETTLAAPFDLIDGDTLAITVGEVTYQHTFVTADFRSPGGATAFEVTASINANTILGFEATTSGGGQFVVIRSKTEGEDTVKIATPTTSGRDASVQMGLPSNEIQTLRLYKNKIPLNKDGKTASVFTQGQQLWSATIANGDTLILSVDGTAPITYSVLDADFVATGLYNSVSSTNSLDSWVEIFNSKLTGVTVSVVGQQLKIASNLGTSNRAQVVIDPSSTLVTKGMFSSLIGLSSQGLASDFILGRNTAQFELVVPLVAGDALTAGSSETEARVQSIQIPSGNITFASNAHIWFLADSPGQIIQTGVVSNSILTITKPSTNVIRFQSNSANAFINVLPGDYIIIWSNELDPTDRIEGRVQAVNSTVIDILITATEWAAAVTSAGVTFFEGFIILRSVNTPQKFRVTSGTKTLDQVAQELQTQTSGLIFTVQEEQYIVARTRTKDTTGSILVVTADPQGKLLGFTSGDDDVSKDSLIAFLDSGNADGQMPTFLHTTFATGTAADPIDSFISSFVSSIDFSTRDPNDIICTLHPYGQAAVLSTTGNTSAGSSQLTSLASTTGLSFGFLIVGTGIPVGTTVTAISGSNVTMSNNATASGTGVSVSFGNPDRDAQPYGECVQETSLVGTTVGIVKAAEIRRLRVVDRFFIANPLDFGPKDTAVVVVDNDTSSKSFEIPLYRRALTNTSFANNAFSFNAYDVDSGPTANFSSAFGNTFDFSNFKVLMQAKKVLKPSPPKTAILYRSTNWGRSGEKITVGYVYPSVANSSISSTVMATSQVDVRINLKSGSAISTSIAATTQWNVTIAANNPSAGIDQVTYTWNGIGAAPNLTLSGGEYVNISVQTAFSAANTGTFKVSTVAGFLPTSTTFTVQRPNGSAVAEINKATAIANGISFYNVGATTKAIDIFNYVNANLSDYFTATLVNDGGTDGSGIITLSTWEDSGFTYSNVQLKDGINWIATNDLTSTPNFTFKRALVLPSDVGYTFNDSEEIRLVPTTMDQVRRLDSILAVTGFTTVGTLGVVDRGYRLEIATDVLGSDGSIQVIGGLANLYQTPVLDSALRLDNTYMQMSADKVAAQGVQSDQWFRLQATTAQRKDALFSSNTSVQVLGNTPIVGQTTIKMAGRLMNQRYFGKPRNHVRTKGNTFRIEKQGALVCLSWNGVGTSPHFLKSSLNFNDSGGGSINVQLVASTSESQYYVLTGNANFTELSIGDLVTIAGMPNAANNGTFLVTGVADDGRSIRVLNPGAVNALSHGTFTFSANPNGGDQFTIGSTVLTAATFASFTGSITPTYAFFSGTIPGTITPVLIRANNSGVGGNSISLTFTGSNNITTAISSWNTGNPGNQATLVSGDGSQTPSAQSLPLAGGTATAVTIKALSSGTVGNSVTLVFDGSTTITNTITAWNIANPANQVALTSGSGSQIPVAQSVSLSGAANNSFLIASTVSATVANFTAVAGALVPNITASASGSVATITATAPSASIALVYTPNGASHVTVSGATLSGDTFAAGNFSASSSVSEGDTFFVSAPFAVLNQGRFRVIRRFNDSVWFENANVIEEEVVLPTNPISLGFDATTSFKVNATGHTAYVNWNGTGTEPSLGNANVGDVLTFGTAFAAANQGDFMVLRSGPKLQQITQLTMPAGSQFTLGGAGKYFIINSAGNINLYYVWFNVNGGNSDPLVVGRTGLQIAILSGDTAAQVAAKVSAIVTGATGLSSTNSGNIVTVTTTGFIETNDPANVNVPSPFVVNVTQEGRRTFLEAINPSAVNEAAVLVTSGLFQDHRPQIQFWEYEATVAGDQFVATGDTLTVPNAGTWSIAQVVDRDTLILSANLASVTNSSLNGRETTVFIQEGVSYSGYKHVYLKSPQPGASTRNFIVFDTNAQYEKVSEAGGVEMTSLNKLDFNTIIRKGLDSYRYNTGLIAEANRIIYGDPRDATTYPGVGAAGAEIFVREPLTRRIQVSIDVRVNTGVPFAQTADQVRTSVGSLVNSNDVGQPIAISAIVAAVNAIPGVRAVAISSPQYDSTHDIIFIAPSEKARIIDPILDISVSQIGT